MEKEELIDLIKTVQKGIIGPYDPHSDKRGKPLDCFLWSRCDGSFMVHRFGPMTGVDLCRCTTLDFYRNHITRDCEDNLVTICDINQGYYTITEQLFKTIEGAYNEANDKLRGFVRSIYAEYQNFLYRKNTVETEKHKYVKRKVNKGDTLNPGMCLFTVVNDNVCAVKLSSHNATILSGVDSVWDCVQFFIGKDRLQYEIQETFLESMIDETLDIEPRNNPFMTSKIVYCEITDEAFDTIERIYCDCTEKVQALREIIDDYVKQMNEGYKLEDTTPYCETAEEEYVDSNYILEKHRFSVPCESVYTTQTDEVTISFNFHDDKIKKDTADKIIEFLKSI